MKPMINRKPLSRLFAILTLLLSLKANATQYDLAEGCTLKKYENGKWEGADFSVLKDSSIKRLYPKGGRVRFKLDGVWHSTREGCLVSRAGSSDNIDDESTKGDSHKPSGYPKSSLQLYGLGGGFLSTGAEEKLQLAFGGGLKAQFGESFALKGQYTTSSRTIITFQTTPVPGFGNQTVEKTSKITRAEIMLIPNYTLGALYFGPQLGLFKIAISSDPNTQSSSISSSVFAFGANLGFALPVEDYFSIGPDFHYTRVPEFSLGGGKYEGFHVFKILWSINVIF